MYIIHFFFDGELNLAVLTVDFLFNGDLSILSFLISTLIASSDKFYSICSGNASFSGGISLISLVSTAEDFVVHLELLAL